MIVLGFLHTDFAIKFCLRDKKLMAISYQRTDDTQTVTCVSII